MSRFKPFLLGAILGAGLVYASLQFHLVRSNDGFYVVSRAPQPSMGLAYVDIRNMSDEDLSTRPEIARAMAAYTARKTAVAASDPTDLVGDAPEFFDTARTKLQQTRDEWGSLEIPGGSRDEVLDAPLWNPFAEEGQRDTSLDVPSPLPSQNQQVDDLWPNDVVPPALPDLEAAKTEVFDAFDSASPFADITDQLDQAQDLIADKARSATQGFQEQARGQLETFTSSSRTIPPFDYASERQSSAPAQQTNSGTATYRPITPARQVPIYRQESPRDSLNRRAREIYEQTRRRSVDPLDLIINHSESRASSAIDELIGPSQSRQGSATTSQAPQRYQRGN